MLLQGQKITLTIDDLADSGDGVGRYENIAIFVPNSVPGDRLQVKLEFVKKNFANASIEKILTPSSDRVRPSCIVADKCGGCQWQAVSYPAQLRTKQNIVLQALQRIGGFSPEMLTDLISPIVGAKDSLHYRNKVTYPLATGKDGNLKAGYYQKGSHRIVNLNQCPAQDERLDPMLAELKMDIHNQCWEIYDENTHTGLLRHLGLRIGRSTGEILITLVTRDWQVPNLSVFAQTWLERYDKVVGVILNCNPDKTNAIFGRESRCIAGKDYLLEKFAGLTFRLRGDTFFQVYTEQAEQMLKIIEAELNLEGTEVLLDAYAGIGTIALPLAEQVKQAIAIEIQPQATAQGKLNAELNGIDNVVFHTGKVEELIGTLNLHPDIVILDPPRKGCEPEVITFLRENAPDRLVYVSCNPATQARDLKLLCEGDRYQITRIQPIDFFPQTSHVEAIAFLTKL
ncbi:MULTISPECIES: 23S rRNA (uracil(1939)-C(5))-methyltransferase RlmD [Pseudanabaena]|uniref:23S rRNA m(5)U-1939 methyltransferase n=2 Tax=Pseudanabaena TaxID=1152 RepID=L8N2D6_9CYAN|nr:MULTISPECIES: 23S rRNA (uracil(1939)-C(5))-methyltransferase RlmD [Pseudanabaena]ELS33846.1 23S rRNA m(5)U-1939 methyltransferase [Pseudanabaena biceps PCC 7429]MDG3493942.1 23S rRNA (uracil(1939)-C(5))-methyltransferase RlmD [Pseudanabaena catenata USMAC16]